MSSKKISFNYYTILAIILSVSFGLAACDGDYRKRAIGSHGELIVVMDSTQTDSQTAQAIRDVFGEPYPGLPGLQPRFDIRFVDFDNNEKLEQIKRVRNLIVAAPINSDSNVADWIRAMLPDEVESRVQQNQNFAFPLGDKWYKNQWALILTAPNDEMLAENIRESSQNLVSNLEEREVQRWKYEVYDKGEQVALSDSLWDRYGFTFRIQHDYQWHIDTTDFLSFRRVLPSNDRWIWIWWKNDVKSINHIDKKWINSKRDSLLKIYIRGTRDSSYVTTEYRWPVHHKTLKINGNFAFETRGTWRMTHDAMGGPFLNYTIYGEDTQRLFMIEFGQFAPKYKKRRFVRQFEAIGKTFKIDSTFTPSQNNNGVISQRNTQNQQP